VISSPPLFIGAIACLFLGHVLKAARWGLFIVPFQAVRKAHLFRSLAIGYAMNVILPFRLGELVRAISLHRLSQLPLSHALSTIILDRMFDLLVVILLLTALVLGGALHVPLVVPLAIGVLTLLILALATANHWLLKRACFAVSAPFNHHIRRWILMTCWSFFTAVRMLTGRRLAGLFMLYTIGMWTAYFAAFWLISRALFANEPNSFLHRLSDHYLISNLSRSTLSLSAGQNDWIYLAFLLTPLVLILLYGLIQSRLYRAIPMVHESITRTFQGMFSATEQARLLPFLDHADQLLYLETFFNSVDSRGVLTMLEQNRDISVVRNVSGGSNATTMLALSGDRLIYRKYALGDEAARLRVQHVWLSTHAHTLSLTPLLTAKDVPGYFSYDMPHSTDAYDLFTYIHSHGVASAWGHVRTLLDAISSRLHAPTRRPADPELVRRYLREKYLGNLRLVLAAPRLSALVAPETLVINQMRYRNLADFVRAYDESALARVLSGDQACTVHGDLTAENIIIDPNAASGYYLIDPNPENLFESEMIDFAKLRQSLNFGYEFLTRESTCRVQGDTVNFRHTISQAYQELGGRLDAFLLERFGPGGLRSICFHELVHYTRMMPYKIRHTESGAHIFYATLVILHNRYHDQFPD